MCQGKSEERTGKEGKARKTQNNKGKERTNEKKTYRKGKEVTSSKEEEARKGGQRKNRKSQGKRC